MAQKTPKNSKDSNWSGFRSMDAWSSDVVSVPACSESQRRLSAARMRQATESDEDMREQIAYGWNQAQLRVRKALFGTNGDSNDYIPFNEAQDFITRFSFGYMGLTQEIWELIDYDPYGLNDRIGKIGYKKGYSVSGCLRLALGSELKEKIALLNEFACNYDEVEEYWIAVLMEIPNKWKFRRYLHSNETRYKLLKLGEEVGLAERLDLWLDGGIPLNDLFWGGQFPPKEWGQDDLW